MNLQLEQSYVAEFSEAYAFPKQEKLLLTFIEQRYSLLNEEFKEFLKAIKENDTVELLDSLCDMKYIVLGTFHLLNQDAKTIDCIMPIEHVIELSKTKHSLNYYLMLQCRILSWIENKAIELGFEKVFKEAFKRVHESNMSKFCANLDTVHRTISQPQYKDINTMNYVQRGDKYYVTIGKNNLDLAEGKLIKSIDYKKVDLSDLI